MSSLHVDLISPRLMNLTLVYCVDECPLIKYYSAGAELDELKPCLVR